MAAETVASPPEGGLGFAAHAASLVVSALLVGGVIEVGMADLDAVPELCGSSVGVLGCVAVDRFALETVGVPCGIRCSTDGISGLERHLSMVFGCFDDGNAFIDELGEHENTLSVFDYCCNVRARVDNREVGTYRGALMSIRWNREQREAIDRIRGWADKTQEGMLLSLSGPAGSGKTVLLQAVRPFLDGKRVAWTAMTGKAALRMCQTSGVQATTLHAALYQRPKKGKRGRLYFDVIKAPDVDYLVVDEISMAGPKIYDDLQSWRARGVRMLFIGDGYQLPPVMTPDEEKRYGKDFSIFREVKGPFLRQVMRSGDDILDAATQLREEGRVPRRSNGGYSICRSSTPGMKAVEDYLADRDDHIVITWRNKLRMAANRRIRSRLGYKYSLPERNEPMFVCKNGDGVLNGEIHYTSSIEDGPPLGGEVRTHWFCTQEGIRFLVNFQGLNDEVDGFFPEVKDWSKYYMDLRGAGVNEPIPMTYGYCGTAHKFQGSEARRVTVFLANEDLHNPHFCAITTLPNGEKMPFSTRWLYTAATRAKDRLSLIFGS